MTWAPSVPPPGRNRSARTFRRMLIAVPAERSGDGRGVARMVCGRQSVAGLDDRGGNAEPGVDLGKLATGRTPAEDQQALRQMASQRRLLVGPDADLVETGDRRPLGPRSGRDHHVAAVERVGHPVVGYFHVAAPDDPAGPAIRHGAGLLQGLDMRRVVGLRRIGGPVDHVVAMGGGAAPRVGPGVRRMTGSRVEERLRGQAADVRAAPPEPPSIDYGDTGPALAGLVRGRLAGRAGADDHEVERFHQGSVGGWRWRRAS